MGANWSKFQLLLAAKDGDTETVSTMIDAGGNIDQIVDDNLGASALHVAACNGQVSVVQVLLSRGA